MAAACRRHVSTDPSDADDADDADDGDTTCSGVMPKRSATLIKSGRG